MGKGILLRVGGYVSKKNDELDRKDFVDFIENLIIDSEKYKRNGGEDAYVIALDSPWGTGKSYFIDLLEQKMEKQNAVQIVKYNAWKNDYCENAFDPLIYDILNSDSISQYMEDEADKENVKKLIISVCKVGVSIGKNFLLKKIGDNIGMDAGIIENKLNNAFNGHESVRNFMFREIPNLSQLNEQRKSFEEFKTYLNIAVKYMKNNGLKLVVVIDELDRCKPTFAIQTLEIVKHIFDVENIIFLFALDMQQLSYGISCVYGQGFDAPGYLCRFFDYVAKMPTPNVKKYIAKRINEIQDLTYDKAMTKFAIPDVNMISEFVFDIYNNFRFSLRDLDTLLQSYRIMLNNFLGEYEIIGAHMIYVFCLALKYKIPELFYKTIVDTVVSTDYLKKEFMGMINSKFDDNKWIVAMSETITYENMKMKDMKFGVYDAKGTCCTNLTPRVSIDRVVNRTIYDTPNSVLWELNGRYSLGNILFCSDVEKWDSIKDMTYREYLHKQLEMYNFYQSGEQQNSEQVKTNDKL